MAHNHNFIDVNRVYYRRNRNTKSRNSLASTTYDAEEMSQTCEHVSYLKLCRSTDHSPKPSTGCETRRTAACFSDQIKQEEINIFIWFLFSVKKK